jgi:hypothetical protein
MGPREASMPRANEGRYFCMVSTGTKRTSSPEKEEGEIQGMARVTQ